MEDTLRSGGAAPDWGIDYGITSLWNEVAPGLWVGGTDDNDTVATARPSVSTWHGFAVRGKADITKDDFDAVVTLYAWARPVDWEVAELRWGIYDTEFDHAELESLNDTVDWAWRRWKKGQRVLCRCQAGLNRSSLVAALVLVKDGWEPAEAIDAIRKNRSSKALFNGSFEALIRDAALAA